MQVLSRGCSRLWTGVGDLNLRACVPPHTCCIWRSGLAAEFS